MTTTDLYKITKDYIKLTIISALTGEFLWNGYIDQLPFKYCDEIITSLTVIGGDIQVEIERE